MPELPPLPASWEEGYDWLSRLKGGWTSIPSWGEDGWDLGSWPYVIVATCVKPIEGIYAVAVYVEGDINVRQVESMTALNAAVDQIAEFYWRTGQYSAPRDLPAEGLLDRHRGPYWGRKRWKGE